MRIGFIIAGANSRGYTGCFAVRRAVGHFPTKWLPCFVENGKLKVSETKEIRRLSGEEGCGIEGWLKCGERLRKLQGTR